jgi:hypothetical protein
MLPSVFRLFIVGTVTFSHQEATQHRGSLNFFLTSMKEDQSLIPRLVLLLSCPSPSCLPQPVWLMGSLLGATVTDGHHWHWYNGKLYKVYPYPLLFNMKISWNSVIKLSISQTSPVLKLSLLSDTASCSWLRHTDTAVEEVCQCGGRICWEIMFFPGSNVTYFMFYIHLWPIYWPSLIIDKIITVKSTT